MMQCALLPHRQTAEHNPHATQSAHTPTPSSVVRTLAVPDLQTCFCCFQERLKSLKKQYGGVSLGEVTIDMCIGGMRGIPVSFARAFSTV
jgi:hypothetical protein